MDSVKNIKHPLSGYVIQGTQIAQGEELKENDVFSSTTGLWEKCPCAGSLNRSSDVIWVRPLK